ncbi:MAG TPA: DUF5320 family protein [Williamwhitmania sp.]|jgi:hypothetical protein|nr:DUF5320 family protein [Williamwhitmania sp.]
MPHLSKTGPQGNGEKTGRGLGDCAQHSTDEMLAKLGRGQAKRRNAGGGEGKGKRRRSEKE